MRTPIFIFRSLLMWVFVKGGDDVLYLYAVRSGVTHNDYYRYVYVRAINALCIYIHTWIIY